MPSSTSHWQAKLTYDLWMVEVLKSGPKIISIQVNVATNFEPHFSALPSANHLLEIIACAWKNRVSLVPRNFMNRLVEFCNWNLPCEAKVVKLSPANGHISSCWKLKRLPVKGKNHLQSVRTKLHGISTYHILLIPHQFIGSLGPMI